MRNYSLDISDEVIASHPQGSDRYLVIPPHGESPLELRDSAAEIWQLLSRGLDLNSIVQQLSQRYNTNESEIAPPVLTFVKTLLAQGILEEHHD